MMAEIVNNLEEIENNILIYSQKIKESQEAYDQKDQVIAWMKAEIENKKENDDCDLECPEIEEIAKKKNHFKKLNHALNLTLTTKENILASDLKEKAKVEEEIKYLKKKLNELHKKLNWNHPHYCQCTCYSSHYGYNSYRRKNSNYNYEQYY